MITTLLRRHFLYFAWGISLIGFCLSIFWGEILLHEPCPLCWYQRIALFPLVLILGVASYRNDVAIAPYGFALAAIGFFFACLQLSERYIPALQSLRVCQFDQSCTESSTLFFPFLSFPAVSGVGFFLIAFLLWWGRK